MSISELAGLISRMESAVIHLEKIANSASTNNKQMDADSPLVTAYDDIIQGSLSPFLSASGQIGGDVTTLANLVDTAFKAQRQFLVVSSRFKEPPQNVVVSLLKPTSDSILAIQNFREKNRSSKFFNHLSAISEAIPALGWVTVAPTPAPFVKEMLDAGQFYANRVLVENKDKDKMHVDWVRTWLQVLTTLQMYVKQYHTTGLCWNNRGGDMSTGGAPPPPPSCGPPPPPPPPPPADLFGDVSKNQDDARAALFREINQGTDITRSLKKVSSDQMTHKNPNLRQSQPVPAGQSGGQGPNRASPFAKPTAPPKLELDGKKWIVENYVGDRNVTISDTQMNQVISVYRCQDSVLTVKGKVNSITLDSCKKVALVFDSIVASVEFINCQSMQMQTLGTVPTIAVDKTDGMQIYLSNESLNCEIVSSKCSEINVSIPKPDGDFAEFAVPEQFKTTWSGKGLKTEVIEKM